MIKRILNWLYSFVIIISGGISAIRYYLFDVNVIDIINGVLLLLILIAGVGKFYLGWKVPLIPNLLKKYFPKSRPEKYMKMIEKEDFSIVFLIIKFIERMIKDMKKALFFILKIAYANKWASFGTIAIISFYYKLTEELFNAYNVTSLKVFFEQKEMFYVWFALNTIGLIICLLATSKRGFEKFDSWLRVKYTKKTQKFINKLVKLDVKSNLNIVEKLCNKARYYLESLRELVPDETYKVFDEPLATLENEVLKQKKLIEFRKQKEKEEEERLLQMFNQNNNRPPNSANRNSGPINRKVDRP